MSPVLPSLRRPVSALRFFTPFGRTAALLVLTVCAFIPANMQGQNYNLELRAQVEFPGQTLANICGYTAPDKREYALVGGSKGLIIVEVTTPTQPKTLIQIPGPNNLWKEIKTYKNFAYITSEGGGGVQIVDLSRLPDTTLAVKNYTGDGAIANQLNTIHALHIDVTKGFLYAFGSNIPPGGAIVLDLKDPFNPTYAGAFGQLGYVHDGYADNDTLYAAHINTGVLSIVNFRNKQQPVVLGTTNTPARFAHNAWLADDRRTLLTTDERTPSFVTSYDVSDPTDIRELDRISTNDGNGSIGHNTHILKNWAITSWYTDGLTIVDQTRPQNLIEVGRYDTWAGTGPTFDGCWGVFPYFPSGTIVASNINPATLFVLTPQYRRAAYFEGTVLDGCTGFPLSGVTVQIASGNATARTTSAANGQFKTGHVTTGAYTVSFSKAGYNTRTTSMTLATGQVTPLDLRLEPTNPVTLSGMATANGAPLTNQPLIIANNEQKYEVTTSATGQFSITCAREGVYTVGGWGFVPVANVRLGATGMASIALQREYYDDVALPFAWQVTGGAGSGKWERGVPVLTTFNNQAANPSADAFEDANNLCYVTGNIGGAAGNGDVDGGATILTSPVMELAGYEDAALSFYYWFYNSGGNSTPNDTFSVQVSNGTRTVNVFSQTASSSDWRFSGPIRLRSLLPLTNNMRVSFRVADTDPGHLVEGGLDIFRVQRVSSVSTNEPEQEPVLQVRPNPSITGFDLRYQWRGSEKVRLEARNALGQLVETRTFASDEGVVRLGDAWTPGIYLIVLQDERGVSKTMKLVKN
jgi:choice-of-anchor B domain-containing protein